MTGLIIGCGYLGERVGRRWLEHGDAPAVVTRSPERARQLARLGFLPIVADVTRPETLRGLPAATTVVYAVSYRRESGLPRARVQVEGLRNALDALPSMPERLIFASSTSVYGDCRGAWIDEDTPCKPDRENGRVALAAEETLKSHAVGKRAVVLRFAGLYGPGRIPLLRDLAAGRPLAVAADALVNLIHIDDAAEVVLATAERAPAPNVFLVSDGHPVPRREFYRRLAELLGRDPPKFLDAIGENEPRRGSASKRVCNAKMLRELGVALQYPTYREGLRAVLARS